MPSVRSCLSSSTRAASLCLRHILPTGISDAQRTPPLQKRPLSALNPCVAQYSTYRQHGDCAIRGRGAVCGSARDAKGVDTGCTGAYGRPGRSTGLLLRAAAYGADLVGHEAVEIRVTLCPPSVTGPSTTTTAAAGPVFGSSLPEAGGRVRYRWIRDPHRVISYPRVPLPLTIATSAPFRSACRTASRGRGSSRLRRRRCSC
ncbi:hypothetical protein C8R45DRAFT_413164 [Mycena sanguinolenta]|nr:hypothetical protein C8R45DRAFT_413164 [Mycena sanguinolenta]